VSGRAIDQFVGIAGAPESNGFRLLKAPDQTMGEPEIPDGSAAKRGTAVRLAAVPGRGEKRDSEGHS